jgi:2-succinyl-5-enolpyruvyl-6-hydroxy-3-cyclohexene-1-carboxylate synthase
LAAAATAYGVRHRRLDDVELLGDALTNALGRGGVELLVVPVDRQTSATAHRAYWDHATRLE